MYRLTHNRRPLFDPRVDEYTLGSPTLEMEINRIGTLSFTIYPDHPEYGNINKISSEIAVADNDYYIFYARPRWNRKAMRGGGVSYKCEDSIARLNDIKLRPGTFTGTPTEFLAYVLNAYNARCTDGDQVRPGTATVEPDAVLSIEINEYIGCFDALTTYLTSQIGGVLVGRADSGAVLDILSEDDLPDSGQVVVLGENVIDSAVEMGSSSVFTTLIPLGKTAGNGRALTIATVNDGSDALENADAVTHFGRRIETTRTWGDVTSAAKLKALGQAYLTGAGLLGETITVTATDLHYVDGSIPAFRVAQWVTVSVPTLGISGRYLINRIKIPLGEPRNMQLYLGATRNSLTDSITATAAQTRNAIGGINVKIAT